jgi:predicted ABC-type ATPase
MNDHDNPRLTIIAGPNGAGKSSISKFISPSDALIFDPDREFKRIELKFPDLPTESIAYATNTYFLDQVDFALMNRRNFTIETNFRDPDLMDTVSRFQEAGYVTGMVYMLLPTIAQSIERVQNRVREGGHYVDEHSIRYNFAEGKKNLSYFADRFDFLELVDASGAPEKTKSLMRVHEKALIYALEKSPEWSSDIYNEFTNRYQTKFTGQEWTLGQDLGWNKADDRTPRNGLSI